METLEKEQEQEKEKAISKLDEKLYQQLKSELSGKIKEELSNIIIDLPKQTDALSRVLKDFVNEKAQTEVQENLLWETMAYTITAYLTMNLIREDLLKREFAKQHIQNMSTDDFIGVKSVKGEKSAVAVVPKVIVEEYKLDTDEKIIEFAKEMPNFDEIPDGEFSILAPEELEKELGLLKDRMFKGGIKECKE